MLGRVRSDDVEDAERMMGEALRLTEGVDCPDMRVAALTAASEFEAAQGRVAEARRLLEEARGIMEAKGNLVALESLEAALAALGADFIQTSSEGG